MDIIFEFTKAKYKRYLKEYAELPKLTDKQISENEKYLNMFRERCGSVDTYNRYKDKIAPLHKPITFESFLMSKLNLGIENIKVVPTSIQIRIKM